MSRWNRKTLRRIARNHGFRTGYRRDARTGELVRVSLMRRVRQAVAAAAAKQRHRGKLKKDRAHR